MNGDALTALRQQYCRWSSRFPGSERSAQGKRQFLSGLSCAGEKKKQNKKKTKKNKKKKKKKNKKKKCFPRRCAGVAGTAVRAGALPARRMGRCPLNSSPSYSPLPFAKFPCNGHLSKVVRSAPQLRVVQCCVRKTIGRSTRPAAPYGPLYYRRPDPRRARLPANEWRQTRSLKLRAPPGGPLSGVRRQRRPTTGLDLAQRPSAYGTGRPTPPFHGRKAERSI